MITSTSIFSNSDQVLVGWRLPQRFSRVGGDRGWVWREGTWDELRSEFRQRMYNFRPSELMGEPPDETSQHYNRRGFDLIDLQSEFWLRDVDTRENDLPPSIRIV